MYSSKESMISSKRGGGLFVDTWSEFIFCCIITIVWTYHWNNDWHSFQLILTSNSKEMNSWSKSCVSDMIFTNIFFMSFHFTLSMYAHGLNHEAWAICLLCHPKVCSCELVFLCCKFEHLPSSVTLFWWWKRRVVRKYGYIWFRWCRWSL